MSDTKKIIEATAGENGIERHYERTSVYRSAEVVEVQAKGEEVYLYVGPKRDGGIMLTGYSTHLNKDEARHVAGLLLKATAS